MEQKKDKPAPVCGCGKQSKLVAFNTFEYFYCEACKAEVQEKPKTRYGTATEALWDLDGRADLTVNSLSAPASQPQAGVQPHPAYAPQQQAAMPRSSYQGAKPVPALPPGVAALKGEIIICSACGASHGELMKDLPDTGSIYRRSLPSSAFVNWYGIYMMWDCCPGEDESRDNGTYTEYYVEGRGWV